MVEIVRVDPIGFASGGGFVHSETIETKPIGPVEGVLVSFRPRCEQGRHRYEQGAEPKDDLLWCPRCGDVIPFEPDKEPT